MRVIAGSKKHLILKTPAGFETRPTADKYKETLFNVLQSDIYSDTKFLDLFSGSGGIGIEALSRGAEYAVFVDKSKAAIQCIEDNLKSTGLRDRAHVIATDAMSALYRLSGKYTFDIIFMDPPFGAELEKEVLYYLAHSKLIHDDTIIVMEVRNDTDLDYINDDDSLGMEIFKIKQYKTNSHVFIRKRQAGSIYE